MIHYLKGTVELKEQGMVVIDVAGIGYQVFVPDNSEIYLKEEGAFIKVYIYMQVREDDISLFGFTEKKALDLFKQLITVNSVGAKAALSILSAMPIIEVRKAIAFEDVVQLTRANGIGKKTAQKIVLELKDKVGDLVDDNIGETSNLEVMDDQGTIAIDALTNLGYARSEAVLAVSKVLKQQDSTEMEEETVIKLALKNM